MTKLNRIEDKLSSIDSGVFHKLCNLILGKMDYKQLNPIGLVSGRDKSKPGTPDTLISLPNGKYIFVEVTTQANDAGKKFLKDIANCFDEAKTGIPVAKIERIILFYNGELSTQETEQINSVCEQNSCSNQIYGVGALANMLHSDYPALAKEYLGVSMDTGQILDAEDFVRQYGYKKLATPLDNPFFGREREIEAIVDQLKKTNLVVLSGRAGSGKTRIALEAVSKFQREHPSYKFNCVDYRGESLHDDIRAYFSAPGEYIVLIDDAYRVPVDAFLYLLQRSQLNRTVKLVLTVRDYALLKVAEALYDIATCKPIEIAAFDEQRLAQMLATSFGIVNQSYQKKIFDISKGNLRLAVMGAGIVLQSQDLKTLNNVTDLYEKYYQSIRVQLNELDDHDFLKVVSAVAFLVTVDLENSEQIAKVESAFRISEAVFRDKVKKLYEMEVLDLYEGNVARVSDQVLATYLLYLAIFEKKVIDLTNVIKHYFPLSGGLFVEALDPIVNGFDHDVVFGVLNESLGKI